ncbi:hypothetical protein GW920_00715 [Candidatus Falkowbacteria bacterium]|uniref:Uncharacterized protein n=1 Tax=Candidatus Falkowbacteria bacterium CG10_big_fil_rev_8_21_14_0_10_37_18 TaxID=1974562 RepID=A0A2H0V9D8_9BACT|nr:hypothetical protein [Candidatus Falkowbacteria bacterium]NCQ13044.1 hypothetical protein [Candidatus Falkowbacteria bacterium]PIR95724.1 MAG: hypothetical protein COT93_01190 [Candidatus Falkowbacteria bacterium CG10_big_fil_rev_8_21_14_0_10_37_18]
MKKIKLLLITLLLATASVTLAGCSNEEANREHVPITNTQESIEEDKSDFPQRDKAIEQYLLAQKQFSWQTEKDSHTFCKIENLKPDQELFPLYLWSYCGEYIIKDNKLETLSGSSGPVKIDYPNELSYYNLSQFSHEVPGDGSNYAKDIKIIFPDDVQRKIFNHDTKSLITKTENFALINISAWNSIKQAIADCEIKSIMQTHALEVTATFKEGRIITAQEPGIDDIFNIIDENREKCGEIIMATE